MKVVVNLDSAVWINGLTVMKRLEMKCNFTRELFVRSEEIESSYILPSLPNTYSSPHILTSCILISNLSICEGKDMPKSAMVYQINS